MNVPIDIELQEFSTLEAELNSQLQLLRSRVEAEFEKPAVVLVTSAANGDGKSLTAYSLAKCFMKSGRSVALVDLTSGGAERETADLLHQDGATIGHERLAAFVAGMRSSHDYTVVDAGTFLSSATATALAWLVDGILLAVRVGRAQTDEDELMVQTIAHARGRVVGVVATSGEAVAEFARIQAGGRSAAPEGRRRGIEPKAARPYALATESLAQLEL